MNTKFIECFSKTYSKVDRLGVVEVFIANLAESEFKEIKNADDLQERFFDYVDEKVNVVYYVNALEFLKDNDPSFCFSLKIAQDFGYEPKNLSSEKLATMLKQEMAKEDFDAEEVYKILKNDL